MEKFFKIVTRLFILFILTEIVFFYSNKTLFKEITKEDGVIEYLTAFILLTISIFLIIKVIRIGKQKKRMWVVFNILMSLGLFFGFGEEISWGQRIFNIAPSDFFIENNTQQEINIHNLVIGGLKVNKWLFSYLISIVFFAYFFLLLLGYKKSQTIKKYVDKLGVPTPKIKHIVVFALISSIIFYIQDTDKWELWECLFATIFLSIFLDPFNKTEKLLTRKS